jgi:hypothetical protein
MKWGDYACIHGYRLNHILSGKEGMLNPGGVRAGGPAAEIRLCW